MSFFVLFDCFAASWAWLVGMVPWYIVWWPFRKRYGRYNEYTSSCVAWSWVVGDDDRPALFRMI